MNSQNDAQQHEKNKNKLFKPNDYKNDSNKNDSNKKDSDQKNSDKETEDPEHEYIAGEKEGDFPPDIKMDKSNEDKTKPGVAHGTQKEGLL